MAIKIDELEGITFYTVSEVAQELRVTPQTIRSYIRTGRLKATRIGRPHLITDRALRQFVSESLAAEPLGYQAEGLK